MKSAIERGLRVVGLALLILSSGSQALAGGAGSDENKKTTTVGHKEVPSEEQILKTYSYEKIQAASTYLFALIAQEGGPASRILPCDPSIEKAKEWHSGTLRYLVDQKEKSEIEFYKKNPKAYGARIKTCAANFVCEGYYSVLSTAFEGTEPSADQKKFLDEAQAGAKLQTTEKTQAWAKKQGWFCTSALRQYLRSKQP